MNVFIILVIIAALGSGLTAGIFYAFSSFVMTALGRIPPEQGIAAMQSMNVAVINPWFMAVFMGTPALCAIIAVMAVLKWSEPGSAYVLAAAIIYIAGSFLVTMIFNVPLNNALDAVSATSSEGAQLWTRYLSEWTWWNHVRTLLPMIATVLFLIGLTLQSHSLAGS